MSWSNYLINKEVWKYTQLLTAYITTETSEFKRYKIDEKGIVMIML